MLVVCSVQACTNETAQYRDTSAHACTNYKHLKHTNSQTIKQLVNKINTNNNTRTNLARFVHQSGNLAVYILYALALALSISTSACV
jgi:hypothetical protein